MIFRTRKRYNADITKAHETGISVGQRNGRVRALNARDHGYADGWEEGMKVLRESIRPLRANELEGILTFVEATHQDTAVEHASAGTRWEKRRLAGRLEALEIVSAHITAQLEEIQAA